MIENLILNYLADHKRIVVPDFGAFIKKEADGKIVFVPFLNKDDGALINLIKNSYDVDKEQAATIAKEYATQIKRSLSQNRKYVINKIGTLKLDVNDTIYLDVPEASTTVGGTACASTPTTQAQRPMQNWEQVGNTPNTATPPVISTPQAAKVEPPRPSATPFVTSSGSAQQQNRTTASIPPPVATPHRVAQPAAEVRQTQAQAIPRAQPMQTPVSTVGNNATASTTMSQRAAATRTPEARTYKHTGELEKQGKVDMFLVIAILAALIAIGAILYGYLADSETGINLHQQTETEIVIDQPTETQK